MSAQTRQFIKPAFTSIRQVIDAHANATPEAIFLIDPEQDEETSYGKMAAQVKQIAKALKDLGAKPGDTIAYAFSNSSRSAIVILGIQYGGFIATAINLVAGKDIIAYVLDHSKANFVVVDDKGRQIVSEAIKQATSPTQIFIDDLFASTSHGNETEDSNDQDLANSDGLLMYTSGTTGRPKGVVLTHTNLLAGGNNTAVAHQLSAVDRGMCVLPLYHINGLCVTVMATLISGSSLVMPPRFSTTGFWPTIRKHACSWFSVVPTQISYLLHHDIDQPFEPVSSLRFGRSASAPLSPEVQKAFESRFAIPVIETMGLTETAAQILSNPLPPSIRKTGSPGIACGNEVIIADNTQCELPKGKEGEILVRGLNVMRCYLRNEEATNQALTPDGWLRTGDLGRMDEDGYVYVTGRLKELIIKGGENIAPREIDEALYSHSDVIEAAAFARPCPTYGERVEAAVMLRDGAKVNASQLISLCKDRLGSFKAPDQIYILPELPKGPSGKIQRIKLPSMIDEA